MTPEERAVLRRFLTDHPRWELEATALGVRDLLDALDAAEARATALADALRALVRGVDTSGYSPGALTVAANAARRVLAEHGNPT